MTDNPVGQNSSPKLQHPHREYYVVRKYAEYPEQNTEDQFTAREMADLFPYTRGIWDGPDFDNLSYCVGLVSYRIQAVY